MALVFRILALISAIAGVIGLYYSLTLGDLWVFASTVVSLLNVYAWSAVSNMYKDLQELKRETLTSP